MKMLLDDGIGSSTSAGLLESHGSALRVAVYAGHVDIVRLLLEYYKDIDIVNFSGPSRLLHPSHESPLIAAASGGYPIIARLLVENGANVNKIGLNHTALSSAISEGHEEIAAYLLQCGADDAVADGFSCMPDAASHGFLKLVEMLLQRGTHVDVRNQKGRTALHCGAATGDTSMIMLLLRHQADLNAQDHGDYFGRKRLPIHLAAEAGHTDAVMTILNEGKQDINIKDANGKSALLIAANMWRVDLVEALLALDADTHISDNQGATAMHLTVFSYNRFGSERRPPRNSLTHRKGFTESQNDFECAENNGLRIVKLLLRHDANIDAQDNSGTTPLLRLAGCRTGVDKYHSSEPYEEDEEILRILVENGAMIDKRDSSGRTILHHTARLGLEPRMRWLLNLDCRPKLDCQDAKGRTALLLACKKGQQAIVRLLLGENVDRNAIDHEGWSPLDHAAAKLEEPIMRLLLDAGTICTKRVALRALGRHEYEEGELRELQCVRLALERGADPYASCERKQTLVHYAATRNNLAVMKLILEEYSLDPSIRDDKGRQVLHIAAMRASPKLLEYLLRCGLNPNAKDFKGRTALHLIVHNGSSPHESVEILLRHGAKPNAQDNSGRTPLHIAVEILFNSWEIHGFAASIFGIAKTLLAHGASAVIANDKGLIPIDLISTHPYGYGDTTLALLRLLIKHGTDITRHQRRDRLLQIWARDNHVKEIALILHEGANVNSVDGFWRTPLHIASSHGQDKVAALLLSHGADIEVRDIHRRTALHHAAQSYSEETVRILLTHGSDINSKDRKGRTALQLAVRAKGDEIVKILRANGADGNAEDLKQCTSVNLAARRSCIDTMAVLTRHDASNANEQLFEITENANERSLERHGRSLGSDEGSLESDKESTEIDKYSFVPRSDPESTKPDKTEVASLHDFKSDCARSSVPWVQRRRSV